MEQPQSQTAAHSAPPSLLGKAVLYAVAATLPSLDRAALLQQLGVFLQVLPSVLADAFRQGHQGLFADMRLTTLPWDIDLGSIRAPAVVCQGDADVNVTMSMAQWLGEQIPTSEVRVFPGDGHLSLVANHADEVLQILLKTAV
jgi:pimeloyl-ACP methyl ester carboxylesterase